MCLARCGVGRQGLSGEWGSVGRVSALRWCGWGVGRGLDQGLEGWCYGCVKCETGFSV